MTDKQRGQLRREGLETIYKYKRLENKKKICADEKWTKNTPTYSQGHYLCSDLPRFIYSQIPH